MLRVLCWGKSILGKQEGGILHSKRDLLAMEFPERGSGLRVGWVRLPLPSSLSAKGPPPPHIYFLLCLPRCPHLSLPPPGRAFPCSPVSPALVSGLPGPRSSPSPEGCVSTPSRLCLKERISHGLTWKRKKNRNVRPGFCRSRVSLFPYQVQLPVDLLLNNFFTNSLLSWIRRPQYQLLSKYSGVCVCVWVCVCVCVLGNGGAANFNVILNW